jgi:hypothetical protein
MEEGRCGEEVGGIGEIDVEKGNGIASLNEDAGSRYWWGEIWLGEEGCRL